MGGEAEQGEADPGALPRMRRIVCGGQAMQRETSSGKRQRRDLFFASFPIRQKSGASEEGCTPSAIFPQTTGQRR